MAKWAIRSTTPNGWQFVYCRLKNGVMAWQFCGGKNYVVVNAKLYGSEEAALAKAVGLTMQGIPENEVLDVFEVPDGVVRGGSKGRKGPVRKVKARSKDQAPGHRRVAGGA